jgi:hypothetical protein
MAIIYLTENLYNKENNILPWRYVGSDQNNNSEYYGSNKLLKEDIKRLGKEFFVKHTLKEYCNVDNKILRKIEAEEYLQPMNVKKDPTYYNQNDLYAPGGTKKGKKHKKPRSREHIEKIIEHRTGSTKSEIARQLMREKKLGKTLSVETKNKMSKAQNGGVNNSNALEWDIIFPDGQQIRVKGLRSYCRVNNLSFDDIYYGRNGWDHVKHGAGKSGGRKKKEITNER